MTKTLFNVRMIPKICIFGHNFNFNFHQIFYSLFVGRILPPNKHVCCIYQAGWSHILGVICAVFFLSSLQMHLREGHANIKRRQKLIMYSAGLPVFQGKFSAPENEA